MSIVAYAIRTCLGAALIDKTLAGGRVYDSAVEPIEEMLKGGSLPFLVVSTDDEEAEVRSGWDLLDMPRSINVVVEIAVGSLVTVTLPDEEGGGQALRLNIPHTDEGLETSLNMIGRQVFRELMVGGPWSDLLRTIAFRVKKVTVRRGANTEKGVRFAARQYVFEADTIAEPEFGAEPQDAFATLLNLMEDDPRLAPDVPIVRSMIIGEPLDDWRRRQADLGLTASSYLALGLGPFFPADGEPVAQRLSVVQPGRTLTVDPA